MKNWIFIFTIALLFLACEQELTQKKLGKYDNGQVQLIQFVANEGGKEVVMKEQRFHENGQLEMEGDFEEGERHGIWKAYFKNGQLQSEGEFNKGIREGYSKVYYSNGHLMYEGQYSKDQKTGHWKFYNDSGVLVNEKDF